MAKFEYDSKDVQPVVIYGWDGVEIQRVATDTSGILKTIDSGSLIPEEYDYIAPSYTGSNMTGVVYKTGGVGGTTVATLAIAYDGSDNITSITRT